MTLNPQLTTNKNTKQAVVGRGPWVVGYKRGFGLIELIVGASLLSIALLGLVGVLATSLRLAEDNERRVKAVFLLEEGMEAVRGIRDYHWNDIANASLGSSLGVSWTGGRWQFSVGSTTLDGFERAIVLASGYRDANSDIASTGTLDTNLRKVTVRVAWPTRAGTTTHTIEGYVANIFE